MENITIPSVVIDTNVIIHFCTNDLKYFAAAMSIIVAIKEDRLKIVVDHYGKILEEYRKNITRYCVSRLYNQYMSSWFHRTNSKYLYVEPIDENIIEPLKQRGFHEEDIKFVRVAPHSSLKKILSTDERSFLDESYKEWINDNLHVICQDPVEFNHEIYNT